jgi:ribonuclease VapC
LDGAAFVLDAHAIVIYLNGEPGAGVVASLLRRAEAGTARLGLTTVNAGEVLLAQERIGGAAASHRSLDLLQVLPIDIVPIDLELASRAAYLKLRGGISYADCFAAALAYRDDVPVVTGDPEFGRIEDVVQVVWLPG